ncbi:alpha/beta hydrolase [Chitinophaga sp. G-6-1-13]|uniref:Alpha/beta hydrolase n=1 Tax=Chitinophaga fulva TaxID=2728842 RepID=A0A848GUB3_9BACT|nr:alpha/beta hydrolase [Chitinophaga fulva]NML40323.1 alpha/beta hydrolase [Chitinophaga fulva]
MQSKLVKLIIVFLLVQVSLMAQSHKVYVLVHGAWHGGWCWQRVSEKLRADGNIVYTPTLSGLGEHNNQPHDSINLDTHITDIVNLLNMEDLHDVVLVGHSYAGVVITGVADRIPERISKLIYLDAVLAENGQSALSVQPPAVQADFKKGAVPYGMRSLPTLSAGFFGVSNPKDEQWVNERLTLQPYHTFAQPLVLKHPYGNHLPLIYIACTQPQLPSLRQFADRTRQSSQWKYYEMKTGHDAMITQPVELANLLVSLSR